MRSMIMLSGTALIAASGVLTSNILSADAVLHQPYVSIVSDVYLTRRQQQDGSNDSDNEEIPLVNEDGSFNSTAWGQATHTACQSTLASLRRSPNPSGASVCFNLPSLDADTGVFEADLRLYRVFPPSGAWAGVDQGDIDVGVGFPSAQVTSITEEDVKGMGLVGDVRGLDKRQSSNESPSDLPELMQAYLLVGQIKQDQMQEDLSMSDLEALLMPVLTLRATVGDNALTTTVSPNSASFITGVFSDCTPQSRFSLARRAVDAEVARLASGDVAFILPGTQILIFPVGLVITGTWALLGIGVYGYGTLERWRFREMYRARKKALDNMGRGRGGVGI